MNDWGMSMNRFNIGDRVWHVVYESYGLRLRKCLVIGLNSFLTDIGQSGIIEKSIQSIEYVLYRIAKDPDDGIEYLWGEESIIKAPPIRVFESKEQALHYIDQEIVNLRLELKDEN